MPRPSATTWLLVLLVLLPTGALAILGFQAADAYDAADTTRLNTELARGSRELEGVCRDEADALESRLRALIEDEAAVVAARPDEDAVGRVAQRLRLRGIKAQAVRLVNANGVGLWPLEYVPTDEGPAQELAPTGESLLHYLRREADRAYYGEGGVSAAQEVWHTAGKRFQSPSLKRLADVEVARLRVRAGVVAPAEALASLHEAWGGAAVPSVELGRPYLLLRLAAAQAKGEAYRALQEDVRAGRTALVPLTTEERSRVRSLLGGANSNRRYADLELVSLEAPVAHGARLFVYLDPMDIRALLRDALEAKQVEPLWTSVMLTAPDKSEGELVDLPSYVEVPLLGGISAHVLYGHAERDDVHRAQKQRRWFLYGAVVLLFLVTLLGMGLTRRAVARERAARRMRDEFIANVTHEVRTPLTSVLLHSEILAADEQGDAKRREHAEIVKAQGKRLAQLVDDMLDFSALERGTRTLESVPLDLGAACREAVAPYAVLAERDGTDLRCEIHGEEVPAMGDPAALARVLANLLGNAWKHGRPARDGGPGRITLRAYENEVGASVEVRDDGPGIPPEEREGIFARFGRGRGATKKEGAGIGLSLSRDLARAMGGELIAFEDEGETVFHLRLDSLPEMDADLEMDA